MKENHKVLRAAESAAEWFVWVIYYEAMGEIEKMEEVKEIYYERLNAVGQVAGRQEVNQEEAP